MALLQYLLIRSAGVGVGVFIGVALGMAYRRRNSGKTDGLLGGSVLLTAAAAGLAALLAMMPVTWIGLT